MMIQTLQQFLAYFVDDFIKQIFQEENILFNVKENLKLQTIELSPDFKATMSQQVAGLEINQNDLDFTNKLNNQLFEHFFHLYNDKIYQFLSSLWRTEKDILHYKKIVNEMWMDFFKSELENKQASLIEYEQAITNLKTEIKQAWINYQFLEVLEE